MTLKQLIQITGKKSLSEQFIGPINDVLEKYQINTKLRVCHFLAQILHESGNLFYTEEIASGKAYENRADLGNTEPGDGIRFKGRGLIQITGRANYNKLSETFGIDFVQNPELLETPEWSVKSAGWFWNWKKLNLLADKDDITAITKRVNGGLNGIDNRLFWLEKCKSIL